MTRDRTRGGRAKTRGSASRAKGNPRLPLYVFFYATLASVLTAATVFGYETLRTHPRLAIGAVILEGGPAEVRQDLRRRLAWVPGTNIFSLDLERVKHEVQEHPWVKAAAIKIDLPNLLKIQITEKQPAGVALLDGEIVTLTRAGEVIGPVETWLPPMDSPVLIGLEGKRDPAAAMANGLEALAIIRAASPFFWDNMETLDLSDERNMVARLVHEPAPVFLGHRVIPENLGRYLAIAERVQRDFAPLAYIELGFPNQVAVMPEAGNK